MISAPDAARVYETQIAGSGIFDEIRARFPPRKLIGLDFYSPDRAVDAAEWAVEQLLATGRISAEQRDSLRDDLVEMIAATLS